MKSVLFAAAAAAALSCALPALAADAGDSSSTVQELVVTGRAGTAAQKKVEASYAITAINDAKLQMQAPISVAEVLKNVPGYWVEASGGVGGANIRARGIPIEGYAAVGIQEDGLPIQHDGGLGFLNTDFSFRLDETVDRVEVVRGGPSSIFASYAPAGVVNFIHRRGSSDHIEGVVKGEVGDYGLYRGDAWVGGPLAGFRVGLGGFYRRDDGVRDPGWTANKGGQIRGSIGRDFENGGFDFDVKHIEDKSIFYLPIPLTNDSSGDPTGLPGFDPNFGTMAGPETAHMIFRTEKGPFNFDQTRGSDIDLTQYTLRAHVDVGGWTISNGLRYHDTDFSRAALFPNTPLTGAARITQDLSRGASLGVVSGRLVYVNGGQPFTSASNGNGLVMDAALREQDITLKEWIDDLRFQHKFDFGSQSHDFTFGLYYAKVDESFKQRGSQVLLDIEDNARLLDLQGLNAAGQVVANFTENGFSRYGSQFNNASGTSKSYALYAADEWHITDKLRVDLGARWEKIDLSGANERSATINLGQTPSFADDNAIAGTGVFDALDRSFHGWSGTAAVNYQFQPDFGAYVRYTRAFRLPSLGDFITNPTNTAPRTQKFDLAEAGLKIERDLFSAYLTGFYSKFNSQSFSETRYDQATNSFISTTQFGASRAYGFELETTIRPTPMFDVSFSATVQDSQVKNLVFDQAVAKVAGACPLPSDTPTAGASCLRSFNFDGHQQVRTPKVSLRATPGINLMDGRFRAELDVQYFGKRFSDLANLTVIPDYTLVNAQARFNVTDQLQLFVYATNLFNEIGLTEGNPRAGQFISGEANAQFYLARPELGRAFRAAVLYRF
jgi:outer membrane receptor protein involved in Fe transport